MYTCRGIFHSQLTCLCFGGESYLRCCESNNHCSTRGSLGRPLGETSTVSNRSAWRFGFSHWELRQHLQKRGVSGNRLYRAIPHFDRANDDEAPDFGVADFQTQPFHLGMHCAGARGRAGEKFQGLTRGLGIRRRI